MWWTGSRITDGSEGSEGSFTTSLKKNGFVRLYLSALSSSSSSSNVIILYQHFLWYFLMGQSLWSRPFSRDFLVVLDVDHTTGMILLVALIRAHTPHSNSHLLCSHWSHSLNKALHDTLLYTQEDLNHKPDTLSVDKDSPSPSCILYRFVSSSQSCSFFLLSL